MSDQSILGHLVQRLEEFQYRMNANSALEYYGAQIADDLDRILGGVDLLRLIDEWQARQEKSPAELQLDEGRGNYMGAGAADEPTGGGRAE